MGADGGTIPKRCELVRKKKKQERLDPNFEYAAKYSTCQLSHQPLKKPIVACKLGRLYNKTAILEAKLDKSLSANEISKHIKTLNDVKELNLTENKAYKGDGPDKGDAYKDFNDTPYICPITALGLNGIHPFLVNWTCGCVFSEKAMQELKSTTCYGCGGELKTENLITLYPNEELLKVYEKRIVDERAQKLKEQFGSYKEILLEKSLTSSF
uniref:Replication termination factor 2 n=1 Tax=Acrobeloides nanus TaxID=290746 RepID=A0A914E8C7_9BILA